MTETNVEVRTKILKADEELGYVFGWGIICTVDGQPYYDLQGDNISEQEMLKSCGDFMLESRVMDVQHEKDHLGDVIFAMPMTKEIASAYNMPLPQNEDGQEMTGFMLTVKPHSEEEFERFRDGTYTGFSLEGMAIREPVE